MFQLRGAPMAHERPGRRHPLIARAAAEADAGRMSRRGFLRIACLLGAAAPPVRAALGPSRAWADTPRDGGVLRCAMSVRAAYDPARADWVEMSNIYRHQNEFLTITGPDNLTRPMLASGWAASDDLRVWTFSLREGVRWTNGDPFTAEQVAWNIARWLNPATGSSNQGLFDAMTSLVGVLDENGVATTERRAQEGAVEVVDPLRIRLHLNAPVLSMPENFYNYPTALLHPSFEGDVAASIGTGPYEITELTPGEGATLRRVRRDGWRYWGGESAHIGPGRLEEIRYRHFEPGGDAALEAFAAGELDAIFEIDAESVERAKVIPGAAVLHADTAQTGCIRMRVDAAPFDDVRVRRAVQMCCDPRAYPDALFGGLGRAAEHHHVAPLHPEYFPLRRLRRDVSGAKRLLGEAGFENGVDLTLTVGNTSGRWQERAARLFAEQAAEAGVRVSVDVVSEEAYVAGWRSLPFGLTQWTHRPLGTMVLALGYRSGVPWNETGFSDPRFDAALTVAEALLDVEARRSAMEAVEERLQSAAVMVQPVWLPVFSVASTRLRGVSAHPTLYHQYQNVWLDA